MAGIIGILMQLFFAFHWLTTSWKVKECTVSAGMSRQLQDGITAKYYTPEKKHFSSKTNIPNLPWGWFGRIKKDFWFRQSLGGPPDKVYSCFPPPCSFKCPHKMPAWDGCSTFAFRTFVWLFSTVCFQMCPQIACQWGCKVALVAFVCLFSTVCFQMCP